jgi:hypothetical protein
MRAQIIKPYHRGLIGALLGLGALVGLGGCADWGLFGSASSGSSTTSVEASVMVATSLGAGGRTPNTVGSAPSKTTVTQPVSLLLFHSTAALQLRIKGRLFTLKSPEDFILQSHRQEKSLQVPASDWVFVGYGVTVPALGLDNYQNTDVRGKTVVMLSGAPLIPDGTMVSS